MKTQLDTSDGEGGGSCAASTVRPRSCDICEVRERSICADLTDRELAQVDRIMARRAVPKGRAILAEGESNDSLYVIVQGSFRLSKLLDDGRRQVTGFLFQGDFLGVRPTPESAYSCEALESSTVCRFPHAYLDEIAAQSPRLKDRLIAKGQTEYHKAQDHIVLLGKRTADERVMTFLALIDRAVGRRLADGTREVPLDMPRQDIADYLGLRLETLSRTLNGLKRAGALVELTRRTAVLPAADG